MNTMIIRGFLMLTVLVVPAGCAGNKVLIDALSTGTGQGVFLDVDEHVLPIPGYGDIRLSSSLKTHKPGAHLSKDCHGTTDYLLLLNIDGQATTLKGRLCEERSEPRSLRDHEEGEGIRYQYTKKIRVKAKSHRVSVALPADDLVTERDVDLPEGENVLTVEPVYGSVPEMQRPGTYGLKSFREGIQSIRLLLNGKII